MEAIMYVVKDPYFGMAMSMTIASSLFIGAAIYDGLIDDVKKAIITIAYYAFLIAGTNLTRILPIIASGNVHDVRQPLAGVVTLGFITIAYLLGMYVGVKIVNRVHKGKHDGRRKGDKLFV